jgi:hypothetical protein
VQAGWHTLLVHTLPLEQVPAPQVMVPPQPLGMVPQFCPEAQVVTDGVQPQTFTEPPPPQDCGDAQAPQLTVLFPTQPTEPQL